MEPVAVMSQYQKPHTTVSKATGRHLDFGLLLTSITVASGFYKKQTNVPLPQWTHDTQQ